MPRMGFSREALKPRPPTPPGIYEFRVDGFKPAKSNKGDTINLNPILKVINNPNGLNDRDLYQNLNSAAAWIHLDFVHALGLRMEVDGDQVYLPGKFQEDPQDPENPTKWRYEGPITGRTGKCQVVMQRTPRGNDRAAIKQFFCAVQGCTEKHSTDLK